MMCSLFAARLATVHSFRFQVFWAVRPRLIISYRHFRGT